MSATRATTGCSGSTTSSSPTGSRPPVPARLELRAGPYSLWTLPGAGGVLHAGTIVGGVAANRTDLGMRSVPLLNSAARAGRRLSAGCVRSARWPRNPATATVACDAGRNGARGVRQAATGTGGGARAHAPGRSRRAQRIVRPRVDRDGRRTAAADRDGRARARRHDRPRGHAPSRVPLPRMAGLPTPVRGSAQRCWSRWPSVTGSPDLDDDVSLGRSCASPTLEWRWRIRARSGR